MLRSSIVAVTVACALALLVPRASSTAFTEPVEVSSTLSVWSARLIVQAIRWSEPSGALSFNTRAYCYNGACSIPGPAFKLKPGDSFTLIVDNTLGEDNATYHAGSGHNYMHGPNSTNVHTHGLHISPNVDNVAVNIRPGASHTYAYSIGATHAPGQAWFHSHRHGSAAMQVMGGLFGTMYVEPSAAANMPASYTALRRHTVVLSHVKFAVSTQNGAVSQGCGPNQPCVPGVQPVRRHTRVLVPPDDPRALSG
jgi:FtsP/CotA-like multicopper oxidase with cupredoxin domain